MARFRKSNRVAAADMAVTGARRSAGARKEPEGTFFFRRIGYDCAML